MVVTSRYWNQARCGSIDWWYSSVDKLSDEIGLTKSGKNKVRLSESDDIQCESDTGKIIANNTSMEKDNDQFLENWLNNVFFNVDHEDDHDNWILEQLWISLHRQN